MRITTYQTHTTMIKQPIGSTVFVTLPNALQEKITTESGVEFFIDGSYNHEEWSTVNALIHSKGGRCSIPIEKGDEVIIHYLVTSEYITQGDVRIYQRVKQYEGEVVWEADEDMILAKKVDGIWTGLGRWVVLEDIQENTTQSSFIIIPDMVKEKKKRGCGKFLGGAIDVPYGATAYFNEMFRAYYRFPDGKERIILNKDLIYGYEQI